MSEWLSIDSRSTRGTDVFVLPWAMSYMTYETELHRHENKLLYLDSVIEKHDCSIRAGAAMKKERWIIFMRKLLIKSYVK